MGQFLSTRIAAAALAMGMAAGFTAACAPETRDGVDARGPSGPGGAAQVETAAAAACATAMFDPLASTPVACSLTANGRIIAYAFQPRPDGGPGQIVLTIRKGGDAPGQTLTIPDAARAFAPEVDDLNGDGAADLLIQTDLGNANWVRTLLLFDPGAGAFVTAGVISGLSHARTADGLLAVPSRSSASEYVVSFYRFEALRLAPVATATVALSPDGAGRACTAAPPAETPGSFGGLNLDARAAQAKFCDDPAAQP